MVKSKVKMKNKVIKVFELVWNTTTDEVQFMKNEKGSASGNKIYF